VTPFDQRGEVDLAATEAVIERFIAADVDGISVLGSTGEFSHLTIGRAQELRRRDGEDRRRARPAHSRGGLSRYQGERRACP
jgi:hypothetical protein